MFTAIAVNIIVTAVVAFLVIKWLQRAKDLDSIKVQRAKDLDSIEEAWHEGYDEGFDHGADARRIMFPAKKDTVHHSVPEF